MPAKSVGAAKPKQATPVSGQNGAPLNVKPAYSAAPVPAPAPAAASTDFDPFGTGPSDNPFDDPIPAPPSAQAQKQEIFATSSSTNASFDPFAAAAPPGVHGAGNDDLDFLATAGSATTAPKPAGSTSTANPNEFDDFFDSLK